jgi:hypothetical protein
MGAPTLARLAAATRRPVWDLKCPSLSRNGSVSAKGNDGGEHFQADPPSFRYNTRLTETHGREKYG